MEKAFWFVKAILFCVSVVLYIKQGVVKMFYKRRIVMPGIVETLQVIDFGLTIGKGIGQSMTDDGKITLADLPKFLPALMAVPAAIEGIQLVPVEVKDLDTAELEEIKTHIMQGAAEIPGLDAKWMSVADGALKIGFGAMQIIQALKKPVEAPAPKPESP